MSKTFGNSLSLGLAGYYQRQVTKDSDGTPLNQVAALGSEVGGNMPWMKAHVSLRYGCEFQAQNRAHGHSIVLTLEKRF